MPFRLCRSEPGTEFCPARRSDRPALPGRPSRRCDQDQHRTADHNRGLSLGRFLVSVGSPLKQASVDGMAARLNWLRANLAWSFALFARARKSAATPTWRAPPRLAIAAAVGVAIIAATMALLEAPAITPAQTSTQRPFVTVEKTTCLG